MAKAKSFGISPLFLDPETDNATWINQLLAAYSAPISRTTALEYRRVTHRLAGRHWEQYAREQDLTKSSRRVLRAAWRRAIVRRLLATLALQRRCLGRELSISSTDEFPAACQPLVRELVWEREALQTERDEKLLAPIFEDPQVNFSTRRHRTKSTRKKSTRKRSKAKLSRNLPTNWMEQLIEAMTTHEDSTLTAVVAVTGCRPDELRKGVQLQLRTDGEIEVEILGSKVSERTGGGQAWRRFTVNPNVVIGTRSARYLYDHFTGDLKRKPRRAFLADKRKPNPVKSTIVKTEGRGWQQRLARVAESLGFEGVSSYSLRHEFATRYRACVGNDDDLSAALGHRSSRMKRHYGSRRQGGGAHGMSNIETSDPVRSTDSAMTGVQTTDEPLSGSPTPTMATSPENTPLSTKTPCDSPGEISSDEDLLDPPKRPRSRNQPGMG